MQPQHATGFVVDLLPGLTADRGKLAFEDVHHLGPLRLPIPSEVEGVVAAFGRSAVPWVALSSTSVIGPVEFKYVSMFAEKTGSFLRNHSSVIMACSISSFLLWRSTARSSGSVLASARCWYQSTASSSSISDTIAR